MASVTMKLLLPRSTIIYMSVLVKESRSLYLAWRLSGRATADHSLLLQTVFPSPLWQCPVLTFPLFGLFPVGSLGYQDSVRLGSISINLYSHPAHSSGDLIFFCPVKHHSHADDSQVSQVSQIVDLDSTPVSNVQSDTSIWTPMYQELESQQV